MCAGALRSGDVFDVCTQEIHVRVHVLSIHVLQAAEGGPAVPELQPNERLQLEAVRPWSFFFALIIQGDNAGKRWRSSFPPQCVSDEPCRRLSFSSAP